MSIINEAIKKARKEFEIKSKGIIGPSNVGQSKETATVNPEATEVKWIIAVVVSLVLVITLLGSMFLYRHMSRINAADITLAPNKVIITESTPKKKATGNSAYDQRYEKTKPKPNLLSRRTDGIIELNGIVYGPEGKWAIINNRITREGDSVPSGKLSHIAERFVKIKMNSGKEITLELR